jgi:hypothetical protein
VAGGLAACGDRFEVGVQRFTAACTPSTKTRLAANAVLASSPDGSWEAKVKEDEEPLAYDSGFLTQDGGWVMCRPLREGLQSSSDWRMASEVYACA